MITFESFLVGDKTIVRNDNAYKCFTLKVIEDTSVRTIPQQFAADFTTNMFSSNASQDTFNRINIPLRVDNIKYNMNFAGIVFEATIDSMSAVIKRKKDGTYSTIYTFTFVKELDAAVDTTLSSMIKVKETDEKGKKQIVKYVTTLDKI